MRLTKRELRVILDQLHKYSHDSLASTAASLKDDVEKTIKHLKECYGGWDPNDVPTDLRKLLRDAHILMDDKIDAEAQRIAHAMEVCDAILSQISEADATALYARALERQRQGKQVSAEISVEEAKPKPKPKKPRKPPRRTRASRPVLLTTSERAEVMQHVIGAKKKGIRVGVISDRLSIESGPRRAAISALLKELESSGAVTRTGERSATKWSATEKLSGILSKLRAKGA